MRAAHEDAATVQTMCHLDSAMIRQHLATMTHGPFLLERQRGACVELGVVTAHSALSGVVTVTRPHSKPDVCAFGRAGAAAALREWIRATEASIRAAPAAARASAAASAARAAASSASRAAAAAPSAARSAL